MLTFQDYLDAIKKNTRKSRVKIQWLRSEDETVQSEFTGDLINGNLNINKNNGVRRNVSITATNINGQYIPSVETIWVRQKFKVWLGLEIKGEDYFISQGVFVLRNPQLTSNISENTMTINGIDKFSLMDGQLGGELDNIFEIPRDTDIQTIVRQILKLDLVNDPKDAIIDPQVATVKSAYSIKEELGNNISNIVTKVSEMVSADMGYDENGFLILEKNIKDIDKPVKEVFRKGDFFFIGATSEYQFDKLYNVVKVVGDNINGDIATGIAENNNIFSNTNTSFFKRVKYISDKVIYSDALAQERAEYELKKYNAIHKSVNITCVPLYHLDVGDVIELTNDRLGIDNEKFVINSISIPLLNDGGTMSINCVNALELQLDSR